MYQLINQRTWGAICSYSSISKTVHIPGSHADLCRRNLFGRCYGVGIDQLLIPWFKVYLYSIIYITLYHRIYVCTCTVCIYIYIYCVYLYEYIYIYDAYYVHVAYILYIYIAVLMHGVHGVGLELSISNLYIFILLYIYIIIYYI